VYDFPKNTIGVSGFGINIQAGLITNADQGIVFTRFDRDQSLNY